MAYDFVIRNGTIIDGMRLPRFRADLGVTAGKIARIGRIPAGAGRTEFDATGLIVAPGFVDLHTHYDAQLHWDPWCTSGSWHGVTTVVMGNCGFGFAPLNPSDRERSMLSMTRTEQISLEAMQAGMRIDWTTFPEYLDSLRRMPKGVNIASYVPLNPLLIYVKGMEAAKAGTETSAEERRRMRALLHEAMDAGAIGFSLQRLGPKSAQADYDGTPMPTDLMSEEDIFALCDVLRERDQGLIQITHGDRPPFDKEYSWKITERVAERSARPVIWTAIAAFQGADPEIAREVQRWIHDCNRRGLRIVGQGHVNRQFTDFSLMQWSLFDAMDSWNYCTQGDKAERVRRMNEPGMRDRLREESDSYFSSIDPTAGPGGLVSRYTVGSVGDHPELKSYEARTIGDVASERGEHPVDTFCELALATDFDMLIRSWQFAVTEDAAEVANLMNDPYILPGASDGGAHTKFFNSSSYPTEFLSWLVRETGLVSYEEAHYHLSYLPAQMLGLTDRGALREGAPADIVVYDPEQVERVPKWQYEVLHDQPAGDWRRVQRAIGYRWTFVNGRLTFADGECTGATPGDLLTLAPPAEAPEALAAE